jgi:hypothetical protein
MYKSVLQRGVMYQQNKHNPPPEEKKLYMFQSAGCQAKQSSSAPIPKFYSLPQTPAPPPHSPIPQVKQKFLQSPTRLDKILAAPIL